MKKLFFFCCVIMMTSMSLSAQQAKTFYPNDYTIDLLKQEVMDLSGTVSTATATQVQPTGQVFLDAVILEAKVFSANTLLVLIASGSDNDEAAINAVFENAWFDRPEVTPSIVADTKIYLTDLVTK